MGVVRVNHVVGVVIVIVIGFWVKVGVLGLCLAVPFDSGMGMSKIPAK